jgi:hypothetical protein
MLTISRQGSIASIVREARDIPARVIPYAASAAATRTAQHAQRSIVAKLPQVFDRPTAYTLGSTFVVPSTVKTLAARVAVKDSAKNNGTLPEDYLLPAVLGGGRKEKRFERNLRYAGVLGPGMRAVLGRDTPGSLLDAWGNLKRGEIQRILTATRSSFARDQNKSGSARSRRNVKNAPYFVGGLDSVSIAGGEQRVRQGRMQPGVYRREGRRIVPVLVFVKKAPQYRQRLDFAGIAEQSARQHFEAEFRDAASAILQRNARPR